MNYMCIMYLAFMTEMTSAENKSICGLPYLYSKDVAQLDDTNAFINDVVVAAVSASCWVFVFLSNLLIIVATVKTPSLHKPSIILVCSLAFPGCLSGVTTQPLFIARLLAVHRADISCDYQLKLYVLHRSCYKLITLLFFAGLAVMSFDRHYALSKPLQYRADASNSDAAKKVVLAAVIVVLFVVPTEFLPSLNPLIIIVGSFVILAPIINHFRILISIRQLRNQVVNVITSNQQLQIILRREKKVAIDMFVVFVTLLISLLPPLLLELLEIWIFQVSRFLLPWIFSVSFMNASATPVIFVWRNKELRNAMKSTISC